MRRVAACIMKKGGSSAPSFSNCQQTSGEHPHALQHEPSLNGEPVAAKFRHSQNIQNQSPTRELIRPAHRDVSAGNQKENGGME